jgi:uncharacterized membrane protein
MAILLGLIALVLATIALSRTANSRESSDQLTRRLTELELEVYRLRKKQNLGPTGESEVESERIATTIFTAAPESITPAESGQPTPPPVARPIPVPPTIRIAAKTTEPKPVPIVPAAFATQAEPGPQIKTPRATEPPPVEEKSSFEMRLGTYWLVRVGIVMLLTSLVFFGNYAYQNFIGKLGPGGKVSLLYLASAALLGLGAWWQRQTEKPAVRNYAQVLFAGGLAAVYFTTYAAHHITQLCVIQSPTVDGVLLLVWAGFMAWIADRRKSEGLALFAVGLAYYTSVITRVGAFTLYSNLLLTLVAVVFLVRNRWAGLSFASLVATYAGYAFWRFFSDGGWHWATPGEGLWFGAGFLMSYWLAFTVAVFLSKAETLSGETRSLFLTLNNGAFFALFLLTMLQVRSGGFWKFSLGYGAGLLALAGAAKKLLPDEPLAKNSYLTQGLLLVTLGIISKFTGLKLALVLGVESVTLYVLGTQRKSLVLQVGGYLAAALAVGWGLCGLEKFDERGLWLGSALGALMVVNAVWSHRQNAASDAVFRPQPGCFALLGLVMWFATTCQNTSAENFSLVLAGEAVLLTFSIYMLRVREIVLLGQGFLLAAQVMWLARFVESHPAPPWWNPALLIAVTLGLSHWWQRQKFLVIGVQLRSAWQGFYALAIMGVLYLWLQPLVGIPTWLALTSLLAVVITAYGVATRAWLLALCGQFFLLASAWQFAWQLLNEKPEWYFPLAPIAALGLLSFATLRWFAARPDSDEKVREPLLVFARLYRWVALVMSIWWVCEYVPERERVWVLMGFGFLEFLLVGWKRSREVLLFSAAFTATGLVLMWLRPHGEPLVYVPNLLAILALLAQQQIARRVPEQFNLEQPIHTTVIIVGCVSLWRYMSSWVLMGASGFYLTASWSALALVIFAGGIALRERMYRWVGLGILAAALGRVIFFDVWRQETIYRVLTFMVLGIVLLVLGFFYNKYQDTIRKWL